jgi:hypothetical protein
MAPMVDKPGNACTTFCRIEMPANQLAVCSVSFLAVGGNQYGVDSTASSPRSVESIQVASELSAL